MGDFIMKTNFHTHCTFCDGRNTAQEMAEAALSKGFSILGFSSHSMYPFASTWHIAPRMHKEYCDEIRRLKEAYKDRIDIQLGFEADYIAGACTPSFEHYREFSPDYLIGSVHYVPAAGGYLEADGPAEDVAAAVKQYFNGSDKLAVQTYFACEREMLSHGDFTILGHPDLIRMQNSRRPMFSEDEDWYKHELAALTKEIVRAGVCVEINTGAIARGYMSIPYPSPYFLERLHEANVPVTIDSDAHAAENLDCWFPQATEYAKAAGYTELAYCAHGGLKFEKI